VSRRHDNDLKSYLDSHPSADVLRISLEAAVPLWIDQLSRMPERDRERTRMAWAHEAADVIGSKGDALQYGGKRGEAANAFNHLARGLAVGAFQPGGISFAGLHFEVTGDDLAAAAGRRLTRYPPKRDVVDAVRSL
jgi:hypothetical protein